jgi:hypothetical protein
MQARPAVLHFQEEDILNGPRRSGKRRKERWGNFSRKPVGPGE